MGNWQAIGYNLEAKITETQEIWIRNQGQKNNFPHLTLDIDSQGNVRNLRSSNSCAAVGSVEGLSMIVTLVKEHLPTLSSIK